MRSMRGDNSNADFVIRKGTFTLILVAIALITSIVTVVAYGVTVKNKVAFLSNNCQEVQNQNFVTFNKLENQINENQKIIIRNQECITEMKEDVKEIKSDVKELMKR